MADTEQQHPPPPNEFHSRLTSPKHAEQVGTEMHNGGILAFKVYPKAWGDGIHHGSTEGFDIPSPQIDDDDDDVVDHMISKHDRLQHSITLPPMSPTTLSPPPKYIASQVSHCVYVWRVDSVAYKGDWLCNNPPIFGLFF